jgi:hypothetical protein
MGGEASGLETTRPSIFQFQLRSKMSHLVRAALAQNLVNRRNGWSMFMAIMRIIRLLQP